MIVLSDRNSFKIKDDACGDDSYQSKIKKIKIFEIFLF